MEFCPLLYQPLHCTNIHKEHHLASYRFSLQVLKETSQQPLPKFLLGHQKHHTALHTITDGKMAMFTFTYYYVPSKHKLW